jgi:hypothetical protein
LSSGSQLKIRSDLVQATFARSFVAGQSPTLDKSQLLTSDVGVVEGGQRVVESPVFIGLRIELRRQCFV